MDAIAMIKITGILYCSTGGYWSPLKMEEKTKCCIVLIFHSRVASHLISAERIVTLDWRKILFFTIPQLFQSRYLQQ